ncbi:MAG: exopolysaccharide biosynthesis polyprenyl glycosylphosphotransferase, partial [Pseudomonadota bacterium]
TLVFLLLIGAMYLGKYAEYFSRAWFVGWFALTTGAVLAMRAFTRRVLRSLYEEGRLRRRVALYGTPAYVNAIQEQLRTDDPNVSITSVYTRDATSDDGEAPTHGSGLAKLRSAMAAGVYDQVVIGVPAQDRIRIRRAVTALMPYTQEILLCSDIGGLPLPPHGMTSFGTLRAEIVSPVSPVEQNHSLKRMLDVGLAGLILLLASPLFALIALAIKLDSNGTVFFRQRRHGKNNSVFRIYKFRTMTVAEDGDVVTQASVGDARVTRVGRLLRKTSLDELPQLLNVLAGDMSLIGPRPHALAHEQAFENSLDLFSRRRRVLPGMTGWAQVNGYRGETKTIDDIRRRMECDLYYIDNWSIWLDLEILARTFVAVFRGAH